MKYALDTNTIIRYLRDDPNVCRLFDSAVERGDELAIPPIVHYEMRRGFLCQSAPRKERAYKILIEQCPIGGMSAEILERGAAIYAGLYKKRLTVGDDDIFIAAFCMVSGYTLITNNTKDFENIDGLSIEDWVAE